MTSFLRALSDEYSQDEDVATTGEQMDPKVFWPVNGFILMLIIIACGCCYFNGGLPWWRLDQSEQMRQQSDAAYRARVARRLAEEQERRRGSPEKRKKQLLRSFKRCKVYMVVQESDLVDSKGETPTALLGSSEEDKDLSNQESVEDEESSPKVVFEMTGEMTEKLPREGKQVDDDLCSESSEEEENYEPEVLKDVDLEEANKNIPFLRSLGEDETAAHGYLILRGEQSECTVRRRVPNCCAICLGCYDVGEQVVWSSNPMCVHAFHMVCLVDWLVKMQDGTPCPCCRAEFTDLEKHRRERRIKWGPDHAFNPSVVRI